MLLPRIAVLLSALLAPAALAAQALPGTGPEQRQTTYGPEPKWYVSSELETVKDRDSDDTYSFLSLYMSYQLTDQLAFGIDTGASLEGGETDALAFLLWSPPVGDNSYLGLSLAAGRSDGGEAVKAGLVYERTFDMRDTPAFFSTDASVIWWPEDDQTATTATISLGMVPESGLGGVVRLEGARYPDSDTVVRLLPGAIWRTGSAEIELDAIVPLNDAALPGVKLGVGFSF